MKKIIIIEDDTILNKILAYNLVMDGYEVDSAYTCFMARELLKGIYDIARSDRGRSVFCYGGCHSCNCVKNFQ